MTFFVKKSSFSRFFPKQVVILMIFSLKSRHSHDFFLKKWSFGGPKLVQVGSKTAQDGPRCGHARQILVSLQDSHYFLGRDTQRESTGSQQVANR